MCFLLSFCVETCVFTYKLLSVKVSAFSILALSFLWFPQYNTQVTPPSRVRSDGFVEWSSVEKRFKGYRFSEVNYNARLFDVNRNVNLALCWLKKKLLLGSDRDGKQVINVRIYFFMFELLNIWVCPLDGKSYTVHSLWFLTFLFTCPPCLLVSFFFSYLPWA